MLFRLKPKAESSSGEESLLIYILLSVASLIILIWIAMAIVRSRVRRARTHAIVPIGPPDPQGIPVEKVE